MHYDDYEQKQLSHETFRNQPEHYGFKTRQIS